MAYINKINVDGVEYEVKDENALPAADLPESINTALAQAKESGEFDGAQGEQGPQGPAGESGVYVGTDTPPEGTKVWINPDGVATFPMPTADDAGKVLKAKGANEAEWGDAPIGGGDVWEYIGEFTTDEDVSEFTVTQDADGNDLRLKKLYFEPNFVGSTVTTQNTNGVVGNPAWTNWDGSAQSCFAYAWLRSSSVATGSGQGVHVEIRRAGNGLALLAWKRTSTRTITWGTGYVGSNTIDYIGGLGIASAGTTGVIGAGSSFKIWGVRA